MKSTSIAAAIVALVAPLTTAQCLLQSDAQTLSNNFGKLVTSYSQELANQTLTQNFIDYSESVNTLMDAGTSAPVALTGETFSSRAAFESASSQQPSEPFQVTNLWYTCDVITFRWESAQSPNTVVGISVAQAVLSPGAGQTSLWKIDEIWGEFDSAVWLTNVGFTISPPSSKKEKREVPFEA